MKACVTITEVLLVVAACVAVLSPVLRVNARSRECQAREVLAQADRDRYDKEAVARLYAMMDWPRARGILNGVKHER